MSLPPITPKGVLRLLSNQPTVAQKIARGWMIVGSLLAVFATAMAVAHFGYEVPIQDNDKGRPATDGEVAGVTALFIGGGLFFVVSGFFLRRWSLSRSNVRFPPEADTRLNVAAWRSPP